MLDFSLNLNIMLSAIPINRSPKARFYAKSKARFYAKSRHISAKAMLYSKPRQHID